MSQYEKLEHDVAKLTITVSPEAFKAALETAYHKYGGKSPVPGFRKGKAPRRIIESNYGPMVFYDAAFDLCWADPYEAAIKEHDLQPVDRPSVDITDIGEDKGIVYTAEVQLRPTVTLGQYKGIEIEKREYNVTDDDVAAEIEREREKVARMVDVERPVENGDTVNLDYEGSVSGIKFEGGSAQGQTLEIGSHTFIDGFEEQMIGMNAGEERDIQVKFPEKYHSEALAGADATFHVKVNGIQKKELPELDDEFAKDVSEYDTLDELKAAKREELEKKARRDAETEKENAVVAKAVDNAEVVIPDIMVERQIDAILNDIRYRLSMQGISLEDYMKYTGTDMESFRKESRIDAARRVKSQLVIDAVAKAEDIKATEEEINAKVDEYCAQFGDKAEEFKKGLSEDDKKFFADQIMVDKTLAVMTDTAVEVEKAEKKPAKKASARKTKKTEEKPEEKDAE